MPIYAYRCDECGAQKDVLQKFSDAPLTQCPQCGAESFHKVLTAPAFQLKGSGWYVTDFRDGGKKSQPETSSTASADAEGSGKAKSGEGSPAPAASQAPAQASPASPPAGAAAAAPLRTSTSES